MLISRLFSIVVCLGLVACSSSPVVYYPTPSPAGGAAPSAPPTVLALQGPFLPDFDLFLCNRRISNPPPVDNRQQLTDHKPLILVGGVVLASVPVNDACFNSGFGPRFGSSHEGIDLISNPPGPVYSAGPGLIVEVGVASGYGNHIVIDHGDGVFTRYAHLEYAYDGIEPGLLIGFGQPIGLMGGSGNATGIHLHYEVLLGDWGPKRSFGLTASDPLSWPAYVPQADS
ncbi:MAG: M23 family metallopeptidase [Pseudomonadota bacterium]